MTDQTAGSRDQSKLDPIYRSAGLVLTWGFRVAAALLAAGLLLAAIQGDDLSEEAEPIPEIVDLLLDGKSSALVDLAIVAMVLTPVAAVIAIAVGFYRIADRRYAVASFFVLAVLGISIIVSMLT
jgi:uncharacterized membrane protein